MHKAIVLLRKIPKGKVTTYAELARACKTSPRAIGSIMRSNSMPKEYPCFKVVKSDGTLGGYGGSDPNKIAKKLKLLRGEGVVVKDGKIDLGKHLFVFR